MPVDLRRNDIRYLNAAIYNRNITASVFPTGCQRPAQPSLPKLVQAGPAEPSLQQTAVLPVRAAGPDNILPAILHSLWSLRCHGEGGRHPDFRSANICRHRGNITDPCRECGGKEIFLKVPFTRPLNVLMVHVCGIRLDWRSTTGQPSISCSWGEVSPCTSPFCSRCTATACLQ